MRQLNFRAFYNGEMIPCGTVNNIGHPVVASTCDFSSSSGEIILLPADTPIMQYTGLKDLNGNEIYEGDILQYDCLGYLCISVVEYDSSQGGFAPFITKIEPSNFQIIGNKFESPELLK